MTQQSPLEKQIRDLAERRAKDYLIQLKEDIKKVLYNKYRPKIAGEEFIGEDIKSVLIKLTTSDNLVTPTETFIRACEKTIIQNILGSIPTLTELIRLQGETHVQPNLNLDGNPTGPETSPS